ncbi:hypothetical protein DEF23_09525 [Marinitenerispora sediminis]|uniref:DUF4037 domain-containing protein n=2 Tax=Marinitenerispora sediminis TaxID=1931232 RepID=A0A368T8U9_9ACTN|nr:hypothetical protein DEF28_13880 [Marinitenerispora sediminis]RCV58077.1 hypothetical protein DEF23_09525 [Marinitenerispora sediminis]RCV60861.1 hypothetical protein DEF24_06005 [Marinitenerispora sediminis]
MATLARMGDGFVPGLDLAEAFYHRAVAPLIEVPHAACLLGEGSEVLGFDTPRSQDHEWGPQVQILLKPEHVEAVQSRVRKGLPPDFDGFATAWYSLAAGTVTHHVRVMPLTDWIVQVLGLDPRGGMDSAAWLGMPQQRLLHLTAGRVFRDDDGELTRVRRLLAWYPGDVWAWLMLSGWHLIGNTEPLRGRCVETGDMIGVRLLTAKLCRLAMELAFLQERRYWPYDKWFGAAFGRLAASTVLSPLVETALSGAEPQATAALREALLWLGGRHNDLGITAAVRPAYGPFEVGINGGATAG